MTKTQSDDGFGEICPESQCLHKIYLLSPDPWGRGGGQPMTDASWVLILDDKGPVIVCRF